MGLEVTNISDPRNQKDVSVSTTTRILFRKISPEKYGGMRNSVLNEIIAKEFIQYTSKVVHLFWIDKEKRIIAEIRQGRSGIYYISAIRSGTVDILAIQSSWLQPKFKSRKNIIELEGE